MAEALALVNVLTNDIVHSILNDALQSKVVRFIFSFLRHMCFIFAAHLRFDASLGRRQSL